MAFHMTRSLIHLNGMIQMTIPHVKAVAAAVCVASLPSLGHAAEQDTVVVTATGFEQKIQDAPASISVITKQQIEDKAYRDVTDALKDVPGVVVTGGEQQRYQYSRYGFAIHALPGQR
jgi:outer membrane receptor for ferrienterochelin and colicins